MPREWHDIVIDRLKAKEVRLVPYVPDKVLTPLIAGLEHDPYFTAFATAREEEAVGIVCGAWMGGAQATATAFKTDLVAMARGAGIAESGWAADEADFEALAARALAADGPFLIAARIDREPGVGTTDRDPARIRDRFMHGLGAKR